MEQTILANRYKVIEKLGEGGMGNIYRVFDQVEKKEVALKQLKTGSVTIEDSKPGLLSLSTFDKWSESEDLRFKQEFHSMAKLKHPNTVEVYEYGKLDSGEDYITMEIVPGKELDELIKTGTIEINKTYKILIQIAQVLNFIHSRHLVHRDIKPSNIRIKPDGTVKIMDFGLMNQMGIPSQGTITGTVFYLPPEVVTGGVIDARSDMYSLGVLAYEVLTGKVPFNGTKTMMQVIRDHVSTMPPSLSKLRSDIPKEMEKIILKLLKKEQAERYQTASELLRDLSQYSEEKIVIETLEQTKSYLTSSELIGRESESKEFKNLFAQILKGNGQSVYVAAPAGVGKSRLIQEFKLKVQLAEVPFFVGQCFEQNFFAYQPISDALKNLIPWSTKEQLDRYGPVLVKVIDDLRSKGYEPLPNLDAVSEKVRLFETVTAWLKEVSNNKVPFVICLEDLHWADVSTIELLNACMRAVKDSKILILSTFRDDEVDKSSIIYRTVEENITGVIKLKPLEKQHLIQLINSMLGHIELHENFIEDVYKVTGGNPFFISETMKVLVEDKQIKLNKGVWELPPNIKDISLPSSIEDTIEIRLRKVAPEVLELLKIASIVGRHIDLRILQQISGLPEDKLFSLLDEVLERQFMFREEDRLTFSHDRVRENLYKKMNEEDKKRIHLHVGAILEKRNQGQLEKVAAELGYHYEHGGNIRKAAQYYYMAGVEASNINAQVETVKFLKQAITYIEQIPDFENRDMVLLDAWERAALMGFFVEPGYVVECLNKYLKELKKYGNISVLVRILKIIFGIVNMLPSGLKNKIKKVLNKPPKPKPKLKGDLPTIFGKTILNRFLLGASYPWIGDYETSLKIFDETIDMAPDKQGPMFSFLTLGKTSALIDSGQYDILVRELKKAHEIFNETPIDMLDRILTLYLCYVPCAIQQAYTWIGRKGNEKEYLDKVLPIAEKNNFLETFWYTNYLRSQKMAFRGQVKEALQYADLAAMYSKKMGMPAIQEIYPLQRLVRMYIERGEWERARTLALHGYERSDQIKYPLLIMTFKILLGLIEYGSGNKDRALSYLDESLKVNGDKHFCELPAAYYSLGMIELESGNVSKAEEWFKKAEDVLNKQFKATNSIYHIELFRYFGRLFTTKKEYDKAEEYCKKSIQIAEEEENPFQASITKIYLGRLYKQLQQHTLAEKIVSEAIDHFTSLENSYFKTKAQEVLKN